MSEELDNLTGWIVDTCFHIHSELGPGLLESVYELVLARRLEQMGHKVRRQHRVKFTFDGMEFDEGFRVDLLVDDQVVVELKSVEELAPVHAKQVLTYIRLMDLRVGLLINFGAPLMKDGIRRIVNRY